MPERTAGEVIPFRLAGPLPNASLAIEASAGTGKTFTLSGLATRFVVEEGFPISSLLLVTFTRAAAAELSDRVRSQLAATAYAIAAAIDGTPPSENDELAALLAGPQVEPDQLVARLERARTAVADFDSATISTIHGFAQQMLRVLGVAALRDPDATLADDGGQLLEQVCGDVLVSEALRGALPAEALDLGKIRGAAKAIQGNAGVRVVPDADDLEPLVAARRELVDRVLRTVAERRRNAKVLSFDDLLTTLHDVIVAPTSAGAAARESLRRRFRVALIDEFQDTDPVQWAIFEELFSNPRHGTRLVLVGDPKQAIYGFRGADIHTYQRATSTIEHRFNLDTNWRSDKAVLDGVETLLDGLTFGSESIAFRPVAAAPQHERTRLAVNKGEPITPVTVRVPLIEGTSTSPILQRAVASDLARHVSDLLARGRIPDRKAKNPGELVDIQPRNIAVLVKAKAEAVPIQRELRRLGIDAVFTGIGSVLDSPAATQWRWLLEAVAQPFDARRARTAALSWFVGWSADTIAAATDQELGTKQEQFHRWSEVLVNRGVADFVRLVRGESNVVDQVLRSVDGERNITDIDHIGELLIRSAPRSVGPAGLIRVFDQLAAAAGVEGSDDPAARRIESEADAVQIMTAHVSKGLQFPVVCVPMFFKAATSNAPYFFAEQTGKDGVPVRTVDIANDLDWPDAAAAADRKARADAEAAAELLRLLYVAMTRAEHHLALWWGSYRGTAAGALSKVLFSRDEDGAFLHENGAVATAKGSEPKGDPIVPVIERLIARSGGTLSVVPVPGPHGGSATRPLRVATATDDLSPATIARPLDRRWNRTSFSSLTKHTHHAVAGVTSADPNPVVEDPENELATVGGTDEGPELIEQATTRPSPGSLALPLAGFRGANRFGTLVHDILEVVDFTADPLDEHLLPIVTRHVARSGLPINAAELTGGLMACLESPLGDAFGGRTLRGIAPGDRLNEMRFQLNMGASRSSSSRRGGAIPEVVAASAISEVLCRHLESTDPLRPWAESLAEVLDRSLLAGHLEGFIDLVARVPNGDGSDRFLVIDYKTNNLTPAGEEPSVDHYRPEALVPAMAKSHYPLQAVLYSVALHRYLRNRIENYRPAVHLGGIAYLFVRGMAGAATPVVDGAAHGVFAWRPPDRMIDELSDLLEGRLETAP